MANLAELLAKFKSLPSNIDQYETAPGAANPENAGEYIHAMTGGLTGRDVEQEGLLPTSSPVDFIAGGLGSKLGSSMGKMAPEILGNEVGSIGAIRNAGSRKITGPSVAESIATAEEGGLAIPKSSPEQFLPINASSNVDQFRNPLGSGKNLDALQNLKSKLAAQEIAPEPNFVLSEGPTLPPTSPARPEFRMGAGTEPTFAGDVTKEQFLAAKNASALPETELAPSTSKAQSLLDQFRGLSSGKLKAAGLATGIGGGALATMNSEPSASAMESGEIPLPQTSDTITPQPANPNASIFDQVSGQYANQQQVGNVGDPTSDAAKLASIKLKMSSKTQGRSPSAAPAVPETDPATPDPITTEKEGTQLGTEENLRAAQKHASVLRSLGMFNDSRTNYLETMGNIGEKFTSKPSQFKLGPGMGAAMNAEATAIGQNQKDLVANQVNDPKSQASVEMRNLARKMGFPVSDNVAAADLDKKFPGLSNMYTQQKAQEARKEQYTFTAGENAKQRQAERESRADLKEMELLNRKDAKKETRDRDYLVKASERLNRFEQTSDAKGFRSSVMAKSVVDAGIAETDPAKKRGLLGPAIMLYGKIAQGDESVLRENDQKVLTSGAGLNVDLANKLKAYLDGGKGITQTDLVNMKRVIDMFHEMKKQHVIGQIEKEKQLGQKLNPGMTYEGLFNPDTLQQIGYDEAGNPRQAAAPKSPSGNGMVKMKAPDGSIRMVRKDQVDAATAAGGELVK